ncbi:MAG: LPS-assembly protein LptD [Formosimonas sp.]
MFCKHTTDLPLKPLVLYVRLAIVAAVSYVSSAAHAQVNTDTAKLDPKPAAVKPMNTPTVTIPNRASTLPYCDDTPNDVLKAWPNGSTSATGDTVKGSMNDALTLKGRACIVRDEVKLQGDEVHYSYPTEQVTATGHAIARTQNGDEISAPALTYNLNAQTAHAQSAYFKIASTDGRGKAESLDVLSSRRALLQQAFYTTCRAQDPDWYLKTDALLLDQDKDTGNATGAVLVFKNVPILASPYLQFPLGQRRQSGLLTPTIGVSSKSGLDVTVPYYFNLAPNYDLTLYPGFMSKRGAKLGAEYRYLTRHSVGNVYGNYVFNDKVAQRDRWYGRVQHKTTGTWQGGQWTASVDAQRASDDAYLDDLKTPNLSGATRILPSEYALQYNRGSWQTRLRNKYNQTLQNNSKSVDVPYDFEPQLTVNGTKRLGNWVAELDYESTRFTHPDGQNRAQGWRHMAYPSIRYEYRTAAGFITPKLGLHATQYNLSHVPNTHYDAQANRVLPIASVDSGLIFERNNASWLGRAATQTLEPRLYYLHVPYSDQSRIWNFDSALADFDLSRIYSENIFTGRDRISNANQATLGLTSRWLADDTGEELFKATVAQRYYFTPQQVNLNGSSANTQRKSDILWAASGKLSNQLSLDAFTQYNLDTNRLLKTDIALRWQPALKKILNLGFHENRILTTPTKTIYASAQWPLSKISNSLYGVARVNYNLYDNRLADAFIGLEYLKDCWIFRIVGQRTISSTATPHNSIYLQLELKGLGALGNDPTTVLQEGISGYSGAQLNNESAK